MSTLEDLPPEVVRHVLEATDLAACDLASLEAACFMFRSSCNIFPNRRASIIENAAKARILSKQGLWRLSDSQYVKLLMRCDSRWTKVMKYMEAVEEARAERRTFHKHVAQVAAGYYRTLFVDEVGRLFSLFWHATGADSQETSVPVSWLYDLGRSQVATVAAGKSHFAVLDYEGQVYTFGTDIDGCCGHGDEFVNTQIESPKIVQHLKGVSCKQVSAGGKHTVALTDSGQVYTWGAGTNSRLGNGTEANQSLPRLIGNLEKEVVMQIAAGWNHTLLLTDHGTVYSFGCGYKSQLGHGPVIPSPENPPRNEPEPRKIMSLVDSGVPAVAVAAGDEVSGVIDAFGQVYTWGDGYCGSLGHNNEDTVTNPKIVKELRKVRVVQVSMSKRKCLFLTDSGDVYGSGWNGTNAIAPKTAGVNKVMVPRLMVEAKSKDSVVQVAAGWYHSAAITRSGDLQSFGDGATEHL